MKSPTRFTAVVLIVCFVASVPPPLGAATTTTFRDEFNNISYSGDDGMGGSWAGAWWETDPSVDPGADDITVQADGAEVYALRFNNTGSGDYVERIADLSAYDSATLVFEYRRENTDLDFSFKASVSANGPAGPFTEVYSIAGGNDAVYLATTVIDITAYRSANTAIRFSHENGLLDTGRDFFLDNVEISASSGNLPPVAVDDPDPAVDPVYYLVRRGMSRSLAVLFNDTDPEGDPLTVISAGSGANGGTIAVAGDGLSVTYSPPDPSYVGPDRFSYTISDGNGGTASGSVDVVVIDKLADLLVVSISADPVNPLQGSPFDLVVVIENAGPDSAASAQLTLQFTPGLAYLSGTVDNGGTCAEPVPGSGTVVCTDGNPPGDSQPRVTTVTVISSSPGPHTITAVAGSNDIDPEPSNNLGQLTLATANRAPDAVDDAETTAEQTPVTIDVLGNDSDADLDPLVVDSVTQGANGSVVNNGSDVTYTPQPDWSGVDTFMYTVSDGNGGLDSADVTVTVIARPNQPPVAGDDLTLTDEDVAVNIPVLANDSDPDGNPVTVGTANQGAHGSVTTSATGITYEPEKDWFGIDSFGYTITDGHGGTATAAVVITVRPVNDAPTARPDSQSTPEGVAVTVPVLANDIDVDGDLLVVASISQGSHGVTTTDGVNVGYAPASGWSGTDSFEYTITDGQGGFDTATVTVAVTATDDGSEVVGAVGTGNRPPVITVVGETTVADGHPLRLEITAEDPDGDQVSISAAGLPAWASVVDYGDGRAMITGIPRSEPVSSSKVTVTAADGKVTVGVTLTIEVIGVNRPPRIGPVTFQGVNPDGSFTFTINAFDPDGDPLKITADGLPAWATLTDYGGGSATISSNGVPDDVIGFLSIVISVTDGETTVTSHLERSIDDLRNGRPPALTHQAFEIEGADALVATALRPRVAIPDPPRTLLTPREGLSVAFGSAVETLKSQIAPTLVLGVVMAWMLMIGVGRPKDEEEQAA